MTTQPLTTVGLVRAYMQEIHIIKDRQVTDDDLGWFNCRWCADLILKHYDANSLAAMFAYNTSPSSDIDSLQRTLNIQFGSQDPLIDLELRIQIAKFIGNTKIKSELEYQFLQYHNTSI